MDELVGSLCVDTLGYASMFASYWPESGLETYLGRKPELGDGIRSIASAVGVDDMMVGGAVAQVVATLVVLHGGQWRKGRMAPRGCSLSQLG